MNIFKRLFLLLIMSFAFTSVVFAMDNLSIDTKTYNEETGLFTVGGVSNYDEVMVSLFDGDELLSFKTTTAQAGNYETTFNITFDQDKTITIKIGDIDSTEYRIATLDVKKSTVEDTSKILRDGAGNYLKILTGNQTFDDGDDLSIDIIDDFDSLEEEEKALLERIKSKLGPNKDLVGIMLVDVQRGGSSREMDELNKGYELFLKLDESDLSSFTKPCMVRLLDQQTLKLEDEIIMTYDGSKEGALMKINNVGIYLLIDDKTVTYKFLDNTGNQTYYKKTDSTLTLKINADLSKFKSIYIDGNLVDSKNYSTKSGSTIITLKKDYMQSLSVGTHNIKVNFSDGEATTTVKIVNGVNSSLSSSKNPKTYDYIIRYVTILILSIGGLLTLNFVKVKA